MLALVAVFSFGAITATSAFAFEPQWLANGAEFSGELAVETTGTLKLIHLANGFLEPEAQVECSGTFDGTLTGGETGAALGLVTALLSGGVAVTLTNQLACKATVGCEKPSPEDTFVVAQNFPWLVTLSLMATGHLWLVLFSESATGVGKPAYEIDCLFLGTLHEVLCEGETSAWLELMAGPPIELLGIFSAAELESESLEGLCEEGGKNVNNVALQEGSGTLKFANGEAIEASQLKSNGEFEEL